MLVTALVQRRNLGFHQLARLQQDGLHRVGGGIGEPFGACDLIEAHDPVEDKADFGNGRAIGHLLSFAALGKAAARVYLGITLCRAE